jgi:hypothetical protein
MANAAKPKVDPANSGPAFLLTALTILGSLLTALGIKNGAVENMARNHQWASGLAFSAALGALLAGAIAGWATSDKDTERRWFNRGILLLFVASICAVYGAVANWGDRGQPDVQAAVTTRNGAASVTLHATASNLKATDHLTVKVVPVYYRSPTDAPGGRPFYEASMGPNRDGDVDLSATVTLPPGDYDEIGVKAWIGAEPPYCFNGSSTTGCLTERVIRVAERPQLSYSWRWIGRKSEPLLVMRLSAHNIEGHNVYIVARAVVSGKHRVIGRAVLAPDAEGSFARTVSLPIPSTISQVCVVASTNSAPQGCPSSKKGAVSLQSRVPNRG